jgi:DNA gyrase subunit A
MIRFHAEDISETGRSAIGVRLIRVDQGAKVATMAKVAPDDDEDDEDSAATPASAPAADGAMPADGTVDGQTDAQVQDLLHRAEDDQDDKQ